VLPNAKENGLDWELLVGAGAPDVDGVVGLALPLNEMVDLAASAGLFTVDGVVLPPVFPNEKVGLDNDELVVAEGVVENGLLVPSPFPLFTDPPNAGLVAVLDNAPPRELVAPNGDPPLVIFNWNLGGAATPVDDSAGAVG